MPISPIRSPTVTERSSPPRTPGRLHAHAVRNPSLYSQLNSRNPQMLAIFRGRPQNTRSAGVATTTPPPRISPPNYHPNLSQTPKAQESDSWVPSTPDQYHTPCVAPEPDNLIILLEIRRFLPNILIILLENRTSQPNNLIIFEKNRTSPPTPPQNAHVPRGVGTARLVAEKIDQSRFRPHSADQDWRIFM